MAHVTVGKVQRVVHHYTNINGKDVEVRVITNPDSYSKDVIVYDKPLAKGDKKGVIEYWIGANDYISNRGQGRKSVSDKIASLKSEGLTAEQILAKLVA